MRKGSFKRFEIRCAYTGSVLLTGYGTHSDMIAEARAGEWSAIVCKWGA